MSIQHISAPHTSGQPDTTAHRPRIEYFDLSDLTGTDARGFVHSVETCHATARGLYVARKADRAPYRYTESWLLPELSLRATVHHVGAAHDRDQTYHLDLGDFARIGPKRWKAVLHYLDITVHNGHPPVLGGIDELLAAHSAGYVDRQQTRRIFELANHVVAGIAAHEQNFDRWLAAQNIRLTWL
ncbi:DUF402 domain-containing protein [Nocardia aurantia]|uniref:DUF402 domain-containing protein n=1 Tax=Nocardia aurantia TaxID=2585199 RepID=A0A7K0DHT4_9NOCA|nr:DUF402 domain-containing protein [Nocardia aurantia]MQY25376.1 hypothetical protein [Nocardia aurantia]